MELDVRHQEGIRIADRVAHLHDAVAKRRHSIIGAVDGRRGPAITASSAPRTTLRSSRTPNVSS